MVAALVAAGGLLAAAAVLFLAAGGGDLGQRLTPGQASTVHVSAAGTMVWTTADDLDIADVRCEPAQRDTPEPVSWTAVSMRDEGFILDVAGQRWRGALMVTADPAGTYSMTCTMSGSTSLAAGDPPWLHDARSRTLALLGATLLASVGVVLGCILAVLVARRRRRGGRSNAPWQ